MVELGYFLSIILTTFVVEDWAIAGSLLLVSQGKLSWVAAYAACFTGIAVGDILLYILGRAANSSPWIRNWAVLNRVRGFVQNPRNLKAMDWAVVLSRAVPGTRFVTYTGAGLANYPAVKFLILTPVTVAVWVLIAFAGGQYLLRAVSDHWLLGFMVLISVLAVLRLLLPLLTDPWRMKALRHTWRRWFIFEFWPTWFAYAPIIPYYIYLSIKNGSVFHPFYANPGILNGGLIGETKWDILKSLDEADPATLKTVKVARDTELARIEELLRAQGISFPLVAKPNIGQRGFAVRFLKNPTELADYARRADFEFLIQAKSRFAREAGIFYIRQPGEDHGRICSITDKDFPFVVGDGRTKLGDLILNDPRARIIAPMYFARHRETLDDVVPAGHMFYLSECGNHSQGAIFIDGQHLRSEELNRRIDQLAHRLPDFYFGRFDVRYRDHASLMRGLDFEIVEINGAGADITHIYDERTRVAEAYRVMFMQWRQLFAVGKAARARHGKDASVDVKSFLKECVRVNTRKSDLSVSS